ncbi:hypothetical protein SDJN02_23378 [Cucurbita argyrosperma subsp. argyrosperma]|nr:hypothetical protein SDJN02_23378 [Cucurbita argyrosperma subsp. argyrosperma]
MELPIFSVSSNTSTMSFGARIGICSTSTSRISHFRVRKRAVGRVRLPSGVRASAEPRSERLEEGQTRGRFTGPAMEMTTLDASFRETEFPVWEKIGAVVRLSYGVGIYGAMALAGRFICSISGIDWMGGFQPSLDAILGGLGYAVPPIMALLFILDGALADIFLRSTDIGADVQGMASLTGVLPPFVPFAQAFAAVITAALTGSLYYVAASPKDPTYVVAPVLQSRSGRDDLKKLFAAWYERRQMKKIYSPLLEGLLALYLGFEWIQTDNILAPMITHGIYSAVILGHGLWKIHDHRRRLRQRIQQLKMEGKGSDGL